VVNRVMPYVSYVYFAVLINRIGSPFFKSYCGLRQGCSLSPYLFLLVLDGLSRAIFEATRLHSFQGVHMGRIEHLTHLLFIDYILLCCHCVEVEGRVLKDLLDLFCGATCMVINIG
jgi:hypothetical protein